jgi:Inner membrane component of T3SS, cytoplasmic domain
MKLRLSLDQTSQTWTLKPNRNYVVGSGQDCDIVLGTAGQVEAQHLKFSFDAGSSTWMVEDLSSGSTFVNSQPIRRVLLNAQAQVALGGSVVLIATPEGVSVPSQIPTSLPSYTPTSPMSASYGGAAHSIQQPYVQPEYDRKNGALKVLTWDKYVQEQSDKVDGIARLSTWYHLITGFRKTPWVRKSNASGASAGSNTNDFNSFDGYIIPDFKGSAESVSKVLEAQLGQLKQYEDTDCYVAQLTDAHLVDTSNKNFLGIELFAIRREQLGHRLSKPDYRRFCVTSYHRVRNYLLVEKYGPDLFVSWVTRCEPEPNSLVIILWLIVASFFSLIAITTNNFFAVITPLVLWLEIFMLTPKCMESFKVLPKAANARLVTALLVVPSFFMLTALVSAMAVKNSFG